MICKLKQHDNSFTGRSLTVLLVRLIIGTKQVPLSCLKWNSDLNECFLVMYPTKNWEHLTSKARGSSESHLNDLSCE